MSVKQIPSTFGLLYFLDELQFTEAALLADPDAQHLAQPFTNAITQGETFFSKEREARRNITRKEAEVSVFNVLIDTLTTRPAQDRSRTKERPGMGQSVLPRRHQSLIRGRGR